MSELTSAIKAWRTTKHPRFALLAELATARAAKGAPRDWKRAFAKGDPRDVTWLFETLGAGVTPAVGLERLRLLSRLNDPRVVSGVLELMKHPPLTAPNEEPFFRFCLQILAEAKDARVKPALESLESEVEGEVASWLRSAIESCPEVPLDESHAALADSLEAVFANELTLMRRSSTSRTKAGRAEQKLLEAIYAAPEDDAPRLVYADAMTERGDLHGELITLQIARARGPVSDDDVRREEQLLANPEDRARWALPISMAGKVEFTRGFPSTLKFDSRQAQTAIGSPALQLLTHLSGFGDIVGLPVRAALINDALINRAHHVETLDPPMIASLRDAAPWPSVNVVEGKEPIDLSVLRNVRSLRWSRPWPATAHAPFQPKRGFGRAFPHLTSFALQEGMESLGLWLEGMEKLESFTLLDGRMSAHLHPDPSTLEPLRRLPHLRALVLASDAIDTMLVGLKLESLTAMMGDAERLIEALPSLRVLRLRAAESLAGVMRPGALGRLKTLETDWLRFDDAFTPEGVVRVSSSGGGSSPKELEQLTSLLASLPSGCVQRIELNRVEERYPPLAAMIRQRARVPVVNRWQ